MTGQRWVPAPFLMQVLRGECRAIELEDRNNEMARIESIGERRAFKIEDRNNEMARVESIGSVEPGG